MKNYLKGVAAFAVAAFGFSTVGVAAPVAMGNGVAMQQDSTPPPPPDRPVTKKTMKRDAANHEKAAEELHTAKKKQVKADKKQSEADKKQAEANAKQAKADKHVDRATDAERKTEVPPPPQ